MVADNAVGAIARIALAWPQELPMGSMLPAIAGRLPLLADEGENEPALRCLMRLMHAEASRAHAAPHMPVLLRAIGHLLAGGRLLEPAAPAPAPAPGGKPSGCPLGAECESEVRGFLHWAVAQSPMEMQALVLALHPPARDAVLAVLQNSPGLV